MAPYWSLYLHDLGFKPSEIGFLATIPLLTKLFIPNLWSWYSDRSGRRLLIMKIGALVSFCFFSGLIFRQDYLSLIVLTAAYSIFWNAILPQFEAMTLVFLDGQSHRYSRLRVWGSIGFIVSALSLGVGFDVFSIRYLPIIIAFCLFSIFLFACSLPAIDRVRPDHNAPSFLSIARRPYVIVFFLVVFFLQFSHGVYYIFYSIFIESYGYSKKITGALWTLGVLSEIVIFAAMSKLLKRFSAYAIFCFSLLATAVRWCLIGNMADNLYVLIFAQLLHAFSFGAIHAVAVGFIHKSFGAALSGQGQALYSAVSFGAGAALGGYLSGLVWHISAELPFGFAALSALFSFVLAIVFLKSRL